jgi:hypothetical protein
MKRAFRDAVTNVLTCWGYVATNDTDIPMDVPDDFALVPGNWQWDGSQWVAYVAPPLTTDQLKALAQVQLDGAKLLKALAIWTAGKLAIPLAQARSEIAAIYSQL